MLNWQVWCGAPSNWDQMLLMADDYTVFQSFDWGEYKRRENWLPMRYWCADHRGNPLGMAQVLIKKLPLGLAFIWASGGPVFRFSRNNQDDLPYLVKGLIGTVRNEYPKSLIRFHSQIEIDSNHLYDFNKVCLRPYFKLNSGYSVRFKLDKSIEQFRKGMNAKHRYYTKKSCDAGIHWAVGNDDLLLADLVRIHGEMVLDKNIPSIGIRLDGLKLMRDVLGSKVLTVVGYLDNEPVTSCLVLLFGKKAFYMTASTGKNGRQLSGAYAMFERVIQELLERGLVDFDFGGIDPVSPSAVGVNHFKCGFGGQLIAQLGEWESASSEPLRMLLNLAIRFKGGRA